MTTPNQADTRVIQRMVDTMVGVSKFSYPARQNNSGLHQDKPKGEFAHIRVIEEYQVGIPAQKIHTQDETTTTYRTYGAVRIRARIGVVESTGIPSMRIMNGWASEVMKGIMIETGYGFISCKPLSSEDAKEEKEWEHRKGFSVDFYTTRVYEETVDNITSMIITGEFLAPNGDKFSSRIEINE